MPWIPVCYPLGTDIPPEVNQVVYVSFLSGNKDTPVVIGWLGYDYTTKEDTVVQNLYGIGNKVIYFAVYKINKISCDI